MYGLVQLHAMLLIPVRIADSTRLNLSYSYDTIRYDI